MEKEDKFEPRDSTRHQRADEQAVTQKPGREHRRRTAKTANPALKRKFSEHPPTKHNSKT